MNSGSVKHACVWTKNSQQASGTVIFLSGIPFVFHYSHLLLKFFWDETLYLIVFIHSSASDWLSWHHMSVFVLSPRYSRNSVTVYDHFFLPHAKKKMYLGRDNWIPSYLRTGNKVIMIPQNDHGHLYYEMSSKLNGTSFNCLCNPPSYNELFHVSKFTISEGRLQTGKDGVV